MAEAVTLLLFSSMLLGCVWLNISVVYALAGGLLCFCAYTLYCKYTVYELGKMIVKGLRNSGTILLIFVLIGCLTALWRASGTIGCMVYYSASSMSPRYYLVLTFLLCCGMSALTGTSFGTASTMGVICASIGTAMGIPVIYTGGAVMSGIYFGEQCSPMSSSALLVCKLTGTDIYGNILRVAKEAAVPLVLTGGWYLYLGRSFGEVGAGFEHTRIFASAFNLNLVSLLPALVIVVFSLFKIRVEYTMGASILAAGGICMVYQGMGIWEVIGTMIAGYRVKTPALSGLIDGGGLYSMVELGLIVAISSSFFGIFSTTNLLGEMQAWVSKLGRRSNSFFATIVVSVVTCAVSCNQTLATMLTYQMTNTLVPKKEVLAVNLEMSVIVISGLIPWSIACAFPLSVVGAPMGSLWHASYLYLIPLWMLAKVWWFRDKSVGKSGK